MHIVQLPISLYSFKLRLALRLKELDLDLREPPGGTYRSAEFRAINPAGTIPTLVDGDFWLAESDAIIEHLEDLGLGRPLHDADIRRRALSRMLSRWVDFRLEPAIRRLFPLIRKPSSERGEIDGLDAGIAAALALVEQGLAPKGPFAAGPKPGLADCGLLASCVWLEALRAPLGLAAAPGPHLRDVLAALEDEPRLTGELRSYRDAVGGWVRQASPAAGG